MIQTQKFPECLKTSRVLPLRKAGKCRLDSKSYRPISIMNPMEKLLEEEIKSQMNSYFEEQKIIPVQHHGGRQGHSTMTAKAVIEKEEADIKESEEEVIILATDLSQAFDLVDHELLIQKMRFHGVGEVSCKLLSMWESQRDIDP